MFFATENIKNVINFKTTKFYKEFVDKIYINNAEPDTIWFSTKKPYTKRDEIALWTELEDHDFDFFVKDVLFETSNNLKEV